MKLWYYVAFCIMVCCLGEMFVEVVFADEPNTMKICADLGFALFGFVSLLYIRYLRKYAEVVMNTYYLLLGIESECGADGSRKIHEKARAFKFLATRDPEKFYKEHIEKETK